MRISLNQGRLVASLTQRERKTLEDAAQICQLISGLSPIDNDLSDVAKDGYGDISSVLAFITGTPKVENITE